MERAANVTPLGPESRDKDARMRAMIDSAVTLFADEGYSSVSTRRIAEAAGCSETLLFRYFGGKHGLLRAILQNMSSGNEAPGPVPDDYQDLADFLEAYLLTMFGHMKQQSARLKVITSAIIGDAELSSEFEAMHDAEVARLESSLRRYQQRGQIAPDIDLTSTAATIEQAGYSVGLFMQNVYGKSDKEIAAIARSFSRVLANGLPAGQQETNADSWRKEAIQAAQDASHELGRVVGLLKTGDGGGKPLVRRGRSKA